MRPSAQAFILWVALPFLLILGVAVVLNFDFFWLACERQTDYVLLSLNVQNAHHGEAFTGAYSRLGFRHPGPILFYAYALGDYVFEGLDRAIGRHELSQLVVSIGFVLVALYAIFVSVRPRWITFLFGVAFVLSARGHAGSSLTTLSDIWNPYPAIASMFCLVVTSALLSRGDARWLFPWSAAAIVSVHTHLGAAPVAIGISGVALALGVWKRWRTRWVLSRLEWCSLGLCLALIFLSSLPIIVEALQSEKGGNIGAILQFSSTAEVSQSLGTLLPAMFAQYRKALPFSAPHWVGAVLLILAIVTAVIARRHDPLSRMVHLGLFGTVLAMFSLLRTQGELYLYLFMYHFAISAVVVAGALAFWARGTHWRRWPWLMGKRALLGACAIWSLVLLSTFTVPLRGWASCGSLGEARSFVAALAPRRKTLYRITVRDSELHDSLARFALVLRRHHVRFCFEGPWGFMVDSGLVCSFSSYKNDATRPVVEVLLADLEKGPLPGWAGQAKVRSVGIAWRRKEQPGSRASSPNGP